MKTRFWFMVVILLVCMVLAGCAPNVPSEAGPTETAVAVPTVQATPIGTPSRDLIGNISITCAVTLRAVFGDEMVVEQQDLVHFDTRGLAGPRFELFYREWKQKKGQFQERAIQQADLKLRKALGLEEMSLSPLFGIEPKSGEEQAPAYYRLPREPLACSSEWTVVYELVPALLPSKIEVQWKLALLRMGSTSFLTVYSLGGNLEIPLADREMEAILAEKFEAEQASQEIVFTDPVVNVGAEEYAEVALRHAANIRNKGELVGQGRWTTVEGRYVLGGILARALLLKAWSNGASIHQAAWFGYLGELEYASTDISVELDPISGAFFLGIGTVGGGGGRVTYSQRVFNAPALEVALYLFDKDQ